MGHSPCSVRWMNYKRVGKILLGRHCYIFCIEKAYKVVVKACSTSIWLVIFYNKCIRKIRVNEIELGDYYFLQHKCVLESNTFNVIKKTIDKDN